MSREALEEIMARAMQDDEFRARLLAAPRKALEDYVLTDQERDVFIAGDLRGLLLAARTYSAAPNKGAG